MRRHLRAAGALAVASYVLERTSHAKAPRFLGLPDELQQQQQQPAKPWDSDWDHRTPSAAKQAKLTSMPASPQPADYKRAILQLYSEPGPSCKRPSEVEALLEKNADNLDGLLIKSLSAVRGSTRHVVLIRHGQYDEADRSSDEVQRLTPLGRRQVCRSTIPWRVVCKINPPCGAHVVVHSHYRRSWQGNGSEKCCGMR